MGFLRTLLIIILIFWGFRILARIVFPFLIRFFVKKATKNMEQQFKQQTGYREENVKTNEGEVKITYRENKKENQRKPDSDTGDYVDFEEVK